LLGLTNGAQWVSLRGRRAPLAFGSRSIAVAVAAATLLASPIAITAQASARPTVRLPSVAPLQTTIPRPWLSEEKFVWTLTNCTRTGGWVLNDGSCKGYGSGRYSAYVKPVKYAPGFSDMVPRPYARQLALRNICTHFYGGSPIDRIRRAGYTWITNWGENIGCRTSSNVKAAVLASHLFFQSEKSSNGGHWRNIKNPRFTTMGVGVWQSSGRVRLVEDFVTSP
jgi:hypothetical protein